jgi:two-component system sensor histidine kinase/response regulator
LTSDFENMSKKELADEIVRLNEELEAAKLKYDSDKSLSRLPINQQNWNYELLLQIAENIKEVFWLLDAVNDKTLYVSPAFKTIWGIEIDDYSRAADLWLNSIHDDDKEKANKSFLKIIKGSSVEEREYRIARPDGEIRYILDRGWAIFDEKGNVVKVAGVAEDITERMIAENELVQSEKKFRSVFEDSYDCIFLTNAGGRIIDVNDAGLSLFEFDRNEVIGKHFSIYFDEKTDVKVFINSILEDGFIKDYKAKFVRKNNSSFDGILTSFGRRDENEKIIGYQGIIRNITLQNQHEKELIKAKEEAEKANDLKSEFLTQMSHEIRTPINTLLSFSSLIREEIKDNLTDKLKQYFGFQVSAGSRIVKTIDSILNMSELQTGSFKTNIKRINLLDTLNSVYAEYLTIADLNNLDLKLLTAGNVFPVMADEYSIHQVFRNLIDNSIKYTASGEISVNIFEKKNLTRVEVVDTGIGMTEEYMQIIFQPFTQEEQGYTRKFEGAGLGLALVKKYCELNKAKIQVESKKGAGTKFTILFESAE